MIARLTYYNQNTSFAARRIIYAAQYTPLSAAVLRQRAALVGWSPTARQLGGGRARGQRELSPDKKCSPSKAARIKRHQKFVDASVSEKPIPEFLIRAAVNS